MADNIDVTPGTGATVATEDIGGVEYQRIKLIDPTVSSTSPIGVASNPMQVSLANTASNATPVNVTEGSAASIKTAVEIMDDWDESDRAKVNLIVGQAGISAGAGSVATNTPRATLASDDPAVLSVQIMDDWDESDRCKVNPIASQSGIAGGAGSVAANSPRVTLGSDDPAVVSLAVIDDWDESDRCKANIIVGQAGVTAGAGAVAANTPRVTHASDDPVTTAVQLIDDPIYADDAAFTLATGKVNVIGGHAVAHGADPTALTAGRAGVPIMNRHHIPFFIGGHPNVISYGYNVSTGASNAAIITISTGSKIVVTQIQVTLGADVSTTPSVIIGFGTASTPAIGNAKVLLSHPALAGGGGTSRGDGSGIIGCGADDEDIRVTAGTITGGSMHVVLSYYTIPS